MPDMLMGDDDILDTARAVTPEDREAAAIFRRVADEHASTAVLRRKLAANRLATGILRPELARNAEQDEAAAARYRRAADALLRPDETAALHAEVAALKAALAAARAAAFKEAAKAVDAEAAEYAEGAHEDPSVTLYVNVLRETEKKIRALAAKENT